MNITARPLKRSWFFSDFKPGKICWLGGSPDDMRIECEPGSMKGVGRNFWVINGHWSGTLYEGEEGCLYIIDERGTRHEPVYIVDVEERSAPEPEELDEDEVPF